ncbi:hypothetical protein C7477_106167 [Phyllobacterium leguminum]|uniref:Uncharacterized protein n=1 Tax=Phyllobacterium leguminum TaxID=314237 RepID=A0A318T6C4_9HYPH|nr:hypothetical protein C7477_106167 [Phyllobacterium leguminum]
MTQLNMTQLKSIQVLRAIAALAVVFFHLRPARARCSIAV